MYSNEIDIHRGAAADESTAGMHDVEIEKRSKRWTWFPRLAPTVMAWSLQDWTSTCTQLRRSQAFAVALHPSQYRLATRLESWAMMCKTTQGAGKSSIAVQGSIDVPAATNFSQFPVKLQVSLDTSAIPGVSSLLNVCCILCNLAIRSGRA